MRERGGGVRESGRRDRERERESGRRDTERER